MGGGLWGGTRPPQALTTLRFASAIASRWCDRPANRGRMDMPDDALADSPKGAVPLSAAIGALRGELTRAWWDGRHESVRFKPSPVELTLQVAVTSAGKR